MQARAMSPRISIRLLAAQSDQRLLALAREGHERAFEALVQRYRRPLLRYGRRMQLSDARAEDVLQQALMQAWIALSRGTVVQDVRGWLYRIVHNVAVNAIRSAGEPPAELTPALQDRAALTTPSNIERVIAARAALGEVAALPHMQRQAIFLTAVDGQTHSEVADTLGVSEGSLRGLLYRARATLRSAAAALTPPPLLAWAVGGAGPGGPTVERIAELGAGSGAAAGIAGLLLKGSVVAVTAGALATGANVIAAHEHHAGQRRARAAVSRRALGSRSTARASTPDSSGRARGISTALFGRGAPGSRSSVDRTAGHRRGGRSAHPRDSTAGRGTGREHDERHDPDELTAVVLPAGTDSERAVARRFGGSGGSRNRDDGGLDLDARDADSHRRGSGDTDGRLGERTQSQSAHRGDLGSGDATGHLEGAHRTGIEAGDSSGSSDDSTNANPATTQPPSPEPDAKSGSGDGQSGDGQSGGSGGSTGGSPRQSP